VNRQPTLVGKLVEARPLAEEDFAELYAAAADPLLWEQHPDKDRWREEVFRTYFDDHLTSRGALAIVDRASGALIGATRYDNLDPEQTLELRSAAAAARRCLTLFGASRWRRCWLRRPRSRSHPRQGRGRRRR
jgi:RimJ/RimL family protein N-acetyltransferase